MLPLAALQSWYAQVSLEFRQLALIFRIHCWMCDGICDESRRHHAFTASLSLTQLCRVMVGSAVCIAPSARNARVLTLGTGGMGASFPAHRHGCRSRQRTAAASIEGVYSNCICQEEAEALHTCLCSLIVMHPFCTSLCNPSKIGPCHASVPPLVCCCRGAWEFAIEAFGLWLCCVKSDVCDSLRSLLAGLHLCSNLWGMDSACFRNRT